MSPSSRPRSRAPATSEPGRAIVTVACELGDGRTLYLAVPIVREAAGEVAALGAPAVVAGPPGVARSPDAARAARRLLRRGDRGPCAALPAGLPVGDRARDLSYLLAPGARVTPLGGALRPLAVGMVKQEGDGEGPRRTAIATARVREPRRRHPAADLPASRWCGAVAGTWAASRGRSRDAPPDGLRSPARGRGARRSGCRRTPSRPRGNDVGHNIGSTLRHYAGEIYGGVIAIVGLVFLLNRKFTDLAMFFCAAVLVGWLVFSPDQVAEAGAAIGQRILP